MEAFILVLYTNGYNAWMRDISIPDSDSEVSNTSDASFRFTRNARGKAKYNGWSGDGIRLYNLVSKVLQAQRNRPGCTFEKTLQQKCIETYTRGNNRGQARQDDDALNGLQRLWMIQQGSREV